MMWLPKHIWKIKEYNYFYGLTQKTELVDSTSRFKINANTHGHNSFSFIFFCRNVVKSFYSASLIFDILTVFGELNDEVCQINMMTITIDFTPVIYHTSLPLTL